MFLESTKANCPYCGELIELLMEPWHSVQEYYEDCHVCCQPILIKITPSNVGEEPIISCLRTDETS